MAGHSNIGTLFNTYAHVLSEMEQAATDVIGNSIYKAN